MPFFLFHFSFSVLTFAVNHSFSLSSYIKYPCVWNSVSEVVNILGDTSCLDTCDWKAILFSHKLNSSTKYEVNMIKFCLVNCQKWDKRVVWLWNILYFFSFLVLTPIIWKRSFGDRLIELRLKGSSSKPADYIIQQRSFFELFGWPVNCFFYGSSSCADKVYVIRLEIKKNDWIRSL